MKVATTAALVLIGLVAGVAPSNAADATVHAIGAVDGDYGPIPDHFAPSTVSILPGDTVTFVNDSGQHNVRFADGAFTSPATPLLPAGWPSPPAGRTFSQVGNFNFACDLHGPSMSGTVVVGTSTGPGPGPGPGQPGTPTTGPGALTIQSASLPRRRFCNKRGPRCRRPGVRFTVDLSTAGRLTGTLRRRPLKGRRRARRFGTLDFGEVAAGARQLRFTRTKAGKRLTRGRYTLTLKAGSDTSVLKFSVVG